MIYFDSQSHVLQAVMSLPIGTIMTCDDRECGRTKLLIPKLRMIEKELIY